MSKTWDCHLAQHTKARSDVAFTHTNKTTKAELPHFILAVLITARNMRFISGLLLLLTLICVSPANAYQLAGYKWPQPTTTFYVDILLIFLVPMGYGMIPLRPLCTIGVLIPFSNIESSAGYMGILAIQMMDEMEWVLNLAVAETHGEALPLP